MDAVAGLKKLVRIVSFRLQYTYFITSTSGRPVQPLGS